MLDKSKVGIIIPAHNEEENLRVLLPQLTDYTVVVVDNGSEDKTSQVAQDAGVRSVLCSQLGYGRAVFCGIKYLQSLPEVEVVLIYDADATSPLGMIDTMAQKILFDHYDFVLGQRLQIDQGAMPRIAKIGNFISITLIGLLTNYYYLEMGSMRAIRLQKIVDFEMEDKNWGWNVEMQVKAAMRKLRILEIPVHYKCREHGHSTVMANYPRIMHVCLKIILSIFYFYFAEKKRMKLLMAVEEEVFE